MIMDTTGTSSAAAAATPTATAPHGVGQQHHSRRQHPFGLSPVRTVVTSFNPKSSSVSSTGAGTGDVYDDGDWVLCVTGNDVQNIVACASSSGEIQLYDRTTLRLLQSLDGRSQQSQSQQHVQDQHIVTEMSFDTFDANVLAVTSTDGTLRLFDIRQHNNAGSAGTGSTAGTGTAAVAQMKLPRPKEEALCLAVGFGGNVTAVGSNKGKIHFFDIRQARQLVGTYSQSHTDEITKLCFQPSTAGDVAILPSGRPSTTPMLLSGSEDGLACIFDTSQPSEDAALQNILAVQTPIREVGFFGPNMDGVYCLTGSECMKLYHMNDSVCKMDFGMDVRSQLTNSLHQYNQQQQMGQHSGTFGTNKTSQQNVPQMEYLVNCHWDAAQQQLLLLAASSKGDGGVFEVNQNTGMISPRHCLRGGHRGVVRSWYHPSASSSFITVGEDARMCEWDPSLCLTQPLKTTTPGTTVAPMPMNAYTGLSSPTSSAKKRTIDGTRGGGGGSSSSGSGGGKTRRARSRMSAATPY
mmetsp:Transcript_10911/g.26040  ORF Transcript_10911/g.26040 Transcript_10911/m.26040 type:complete len:521 (+) Transcript_10911:179-1741(+)